MPKNRHCTKPFATGRHHSNFSQHSNSNRKQMHHLPQIKSILKRVNLNESTVSEALRSKLTEKQLENDSKKLISSGDTCTLQQHLMDDHERLAASKGQVLMKNRVKFSDTVQAFSIGDGWKMSIFIEKLKNEAEQQQNRSKKLSHSYKEHMTKFTPMPKRLLGKAITDGP